MPDSNGEQCQMALYQADRRLYRAEMSYAPSVRQRPHGIGRWMARAPRYLYRVGLGRLLGRRFVLLEHRGRHTGAARQTVLEVIEGDERSITVAAAWGPNSDWFRNIMLEPSVLVSSGSRSRVPAQAAVVPKTDAARVFEHYGGRHPKAARALAKTLQLPFGDSIAMADMVPVVCLTLRATDI